MSMLYFNMKDLNNYVEFGLKAYKLALELQVTKEIYFIGKSLGRFLYLGAEKEGGLKMMQQSYKIALYIDVCLPTHGVINAGYPKRRSRRHKYR